MSQITNRFLIPFPALTVLGNNTGSTAQPQYLTMAQLAAILPVFSSIAKGLAPASGGGTTNYLRADGSWSTPPGAGSVTSVGFSDASTLPIYVVTNSPVTSTGTLTITLQTQSANTILAGPATGSAAQPTFRALIGTDLPNPTVSTKGGVQSFAAVTSQFLTEISTSGVVSAAQPAFTDISGTLAINKGGTGQITKAAAFDALSPMTTGGDIIYGGASGTGTRLANGAAGQVLTSAGTTLPPTWTTTGTGTVTSVALSLPSFITVSGSPVTTSGTLTGTLATQTAGTVFAGPVSGAAAAPTFRALQVPYMQYISNGGQSITADVTNVTWSTQVKDSNAAWNGTQFTAPVAGMYSIAGSIRTTTAINTTIDAYINASIVTRLGTTNNGTTSILNLAGLLYLNANDVLSVRLSTSATLVSGSTVHTISIANLIGTA